MISLAPLAMPSRCKKCDSEFPVDRRRRYCEPCATAPKIKTFNRLLNCLDCGCDITDRHFHTRFCMKCSANQTKRRQANYTNGHQKNDNDIGRQVTKFAIRAGFLLPPTNFICVHCNVRQAECYDHRDYNKPLEVDPVCLSCNSSRGRGIQFFSPHRK